MPLGPRVVRCKYGLAIQLEPLGARYKPLRSPVSIHQSWLCYSGKQQQVCARRCSQQPWCLARPLASICSHPCPSFTLAEMSLQRQQTTGSQLPGRLRRTTPSAQLRCAFCAFQRGKHCSQHIKSKSVCRLLGLAGEERRSEPFARVAFL